MHTQSHKDRLEYWEVDLLSQDRLEYWEVDLLSQDRLEYWEVDLLSQVQHSLQRAVGSARQGWSISTAALQWFCFGCLPCMCN